MENKLHIAIDSPCSESWEDMRPTEGGRHCNRCAKTVVDLSGMTDSQVLEYLTRADWSRGICVQAADHQLQRSSDMTRRAMPRLAAATLVALLGLSSPEARAQHPLPTHIYENIAGFIFRDTAINNTLAFGAPSDSIVIVIDNEVFDGDIESIDRSTVDSFEWIKSPMGGFCAGGKDVLVITTRKVKTLAPVEVVARCEKYYRGTAGFSYHVRRPWKLPLFTRDHYSSSLSVFPNPSQRGGVITVKTTATDERTLIVTDMQGRVVHMSRAIPQGGLIRLTIPANWSASSYILSLSEKGERPESIKLIIK